MKNLKFLLVLMLLFSQASFAQAFKLNKNIVTVEGHKFALWEKSPKKPKGVIVLIHGFTWSSLPNFDLHAPGENLSVMDDFAALGYSTYALDLRGYGGTPRDASGWITPDKAARDIVGVIEWLKTRTPHKVNLLGYSSGSVLTHLVAQRRPDLVLTATLFGYPKSKVLDNFISKTAPAQPEKKPNTLDAAKSDFITKGAVSKSAVEAYAAAALKSDPIHNDWRNFSEWRELNPSKLTVPTLVIHGALDSEATGEGTSVFLGLGTSDRQWVIVPGGDHGLHIEKPRTYFIDAIVNFIELPRS